MSEAKVRFIPVSRTTPHLSVLTPSVSIGCEGECVLSVRAPGAGNRGGMWAVGCIAPSGAFVSYPDVPDDIGLNVDDKGYIHTKRLEGK